jgi:NADPH-dependent curcumin reductase CurA
MVQNKSLIYSAVPTGVPVPGKDLTTTTTAEFDVNQPAPAGGLIVKNLYASFDPYMRGRMRDPSIKSYSPPYELEKPLNGYGVAKVLASGTAKFAVGDVIQGVALNIESYSVVPARLIDAGFLHKIDTSANIDLRHYLSALGMPGLTAYSSFYEIGKPKKGETIFISSAAGAVGQIVGQLAKLEGLTVIGSVGSDVKVEFLTKELKFDGGFNYKTERPADALKRLAPNGIDIYFENVGGEHLEAAIDAMKDYGRIVACGMVSQYNLTPEERYPLRNLTSIVSKRITFRGFIVSDKDMGPVYVKERDEKITKAIQDGSLAFKFDETVGVENAAEGLVGMLQGKNFGKALLKIHEDE